MHSFINSLILLIIGYTCYGQEHRVLVHSHNDYEQETPFYTAFANRVFVIEADVYAMPDGRLLVAHDRAELDDGRTLERLYIKPIVGVLEANAGRAWPGSDDRFVLMIDLKTPAASTLNRIVQLVSAYPAVFDDRVNPLAVQVVISGDMPAPAAFDDYPPFILFDGRIATDYTPEQLDRVAFFSASFRDYSRWTGEHDLAPADKAELANVIEAVHVKGKQVRFWATPDNERSWKTLHALGVDIINTDRIAACVDYFKSIGSEKKEGAKQGAY